MKTLFRALNRLLSRLFGIRMLRVNSLEELRARLAHAELPLEDTLNASTTIMTANAGGSDGTLVDDALLDRLLLRLKKTGKIEYTGEYGVEITTFIPLVHWLKQEGLLFDRKVLTYRGMRPYYFFLDDDEFGAKDDSRAYVPAHARDWPTNSTYTATRKAWHRPPDYRAFYITRARTFSRPTLFIQNKFTVEWGYGPINYLPLTHLNRLLSLTARKFQIVFSRPSVRNSGSGYSADGDLYSDYPDFDVVRQFQDVLVLEEIAARENRPYNEVKLEVLAGTHLFFAVQGGSADILAAFGNSLLAILHRRGDELPHAYQRGPYKYLSNDPPKLLIARNDAELDSAISVFASANVVDDKVVCDPGEFPKPIVRCGCGSE
jgi:hypothetical protein